MYLSGIDFPNEIINAIKNKSLVVFAGAGVSMYTPTSLPDFKNLTKQIAEGSGKELKNKDSCEVFLGNLNACGTDVNKLAANILSGASLEHNKLHKAIVDLFQSNEDIKIVTTNYDKMFEQVIEEREETVKIYNVPALPLGNDINGIIHIHGNIDNPKYMVLTDEDFGRAYLTDGYVSKFLVQLFSSYTVLFIGYSYNDTILRYLTRAISRNNNKLYILTDNKKVDWTILGINHIYFPRRSYAVMREGLIKLGISSKKGLFEWKNQFDSLCDNPPRDLTGNGEIDYCLEDTTRSNILAKSVKGEAWFNLLEQKGVFEECFLDKVTDDSKCYLWSSWLIDNFVGDDDKVILLLVFKHKNIISKNFAECLIKKLLYIDEIDTEYLNYYLTILDNHLDKSWIINEFIKILADKGEYTSAFTLFKKLYECNMLLERKTWIDKDSWNLKHSFIGDYSDIESAWKMIKKEIIKNSSREIILFVVNKLNELHKKYLFINPKSNYVEPWELILLKLEDSNDLFRENPVSILCEMMFDSAVVSKSYDYDFLRVMLNNGVESDSIVLKNISLKSIRYTKVFTAKEQLNIVINNNLITLDLCREQVYLLVSTFFTELNSNDKNILINTIEKLKEDGSKSNMYKVYNWCVWIQRFDPNNIKINIIIKGIQSKFNFKPRQHPELLVWSSSDKIDYNISPFSEEEFVRLPIDEAVYNLKTYTTDSMNGVNRNGLLNVFSSCISKNGNWTIAIIDELVCKNVKNRDIWEYVFNGLLNSDNILCNFKSILKLIKENISIMGDTNLIALYLYKVIQIMDVKDIYLENDSNIYATLMVIWVNRNDKTSMISKSIYDINNTTVGSILFSLIHMVSLLDKREIPQEYKKFFNEVLSLKSWEINIAVCILVGHFNFFCYRDIEWSTNKLLPYLTGKNRELFTRAWEGLVYFSSGINKDTTDIISKVYFKALNHIDWLEDYSKEKFIDNFLGLLIYVIEKPTLKYIPQFYRLASATDRKLFITKINKRLKEMSPLERNDWWNSWLRHFIENRKNNKPLELEDEENNAIMNLVSKFPEKFQEIVDVICKGKFPSNVDSMFWYNIREMNVSAKNSHSMAKLIINVMENETGPSSCNIYIREIIGKIGVLDIKEREALQELLLKNNIDIILE